MDEEIEFLMKTNVGEDFKSLAQLHQSGKFKEAMLALK